MNNTNAIPQSQALLTELAFKGLSAAQAYGALIELEHNTAPDIAIDLYDLTGDPATPLVPGKQARLNAKKEALKTARTALTAAINAGREYCRQGIGVLKGTLGTRYNSAWTAAGFLAPSLAVPDRPVPMLLQFRQYFERFPAQENAPLNLTAAQAQVRMAAIQGADLALATAEANVVTAKAARDAALDKLYGRISDLRGELEQVLEDDDARWYDFGFRRPIDGRIPTPVTGIVLTLLGPGAVRVTWDSSTRTTNYRVKWRVQGGSAPIVELGLFTERQCTITGLPSGSTIVVSVSARNASGETAVTEGSIVVP